MTLNYYLMRHLPVKLIRGMTLLEVLVALAIFAIAAAAAIKTMTSEIQALSYLEERMLGQWVAENRITELQLKGWPDIDETQGESELANRTWYWKSQIIATSSEQIRRIEVQVFDDPKREQSVYSMVGFVGNR